METLEQKQEAVLTELSRFSDQMQVYEYLITLGKSNEDPEGSIRTEQNLLPGCQSRVWIDAVMVDDTMQFVTYSDSVIIRGILSLLTRILNNHSPGEIVEADLSFLEKAGLTTGLSPARADGISAIIRHMRQMARNLQDRDR